MLVSTGGADLARRHAPRWPGAVRMMRVGWGSFQEANQGCE